MKNDLAELQLELAAIDAHFTPIGLELREGLDMHDWAKIGTRLCRMDQVVKWWVGDWAAFGLRAYGKLKEFSETNGINYQTLANLAWVSGSVEVSRRRESLPWTLHAEVAGLEPAKQIEWLDKVESEKLPCSELRKQIRQSKGERNALASDGPQVKFASKCFDDANHFLRTAPDSFWEEPGRWQAWIERLQPMYDRYLWLRQKAQEVKCR